jgi:hypothetical protein
LLRLLPLCQQQWQGGWVLTSLLLLLLLLLLMWMWMWIWM